MFRYGYRSSDVMECHKCPVAEEIAEGLHKNTSYEDSPCATCIRGRKDAPLSNKGRSHVSFSDTISVSLGDDTALRGNARYRASRGLTVLPDSLDIFDPASFDQEREHENDLTDVVAGVSYLLKAILSLDPITREIVMDRIAYPERPLSVVGERMKLGRSAVHERLKKAREQWPALCWSIGMKSWSWKKGDEEDEDN